MRTKLNERIMCAVIFTAMFIFLLLQFHNVMVYFDDYGYYSLSYGVNAAKGGHEFTFSELLSYLKVHYFDVNGRIPGYVVWLGLYIIGGLGLVQFAAAVFVLLILLSIWCFIDNRKHSVLSALFVCAFYGLISLKMHRQGTYWFAAFFQYVAPVSAIVAFAILYFKTRDISHAATYKFVLCALILISAYSQEQLSVTVTFMTLLLIVFEVIEKKLTKWNFVYTALAIMCVAALLLSPSAQSRASTSGYSTYETIIYSTYNTIRTFYGSDISVLIVLLHTALLAFSAKLFIQDNHIFKLFDLAGIMLAFATIAIYLCSPICQLFAQYTFYRYYVLIALGVPCISVLAIQIMRYYWCNNLYRNLLLFMTAVASVGCLCFVPETPPRLFISSWLLLFPTLSDGIFGITELLKKEKNKVALLYVICAIIVSFAAYNSISIYRGYLANAEVFLYNDYQLTEAANKEKSGDVINEIYLRTMPYYDCGAAMIYDKEVTYMKHWMKYFYDLNSDPAFYFNEQGIAPESTETYADNGEKIYVMK